MVVSSLPFPAEMGLLLGVGAEWAEGAEPGPSRPRLLGLGTTASILTQ